MKPTEQAEAELTEKFIQHHMRDDSRNSYVQNGQWAYSRGYRAGLKQAAAPKREWVDLTEWQIAKVLQQCQDEQTRPPSEDFAFKFANKIEAKLKEKNQ